MAVRFDGVCAAVALLVSVLGGQALDLLKATATSGDPPSAPMVHCWCSSYPNVTRCSWPQPSGAAPTHYIATYSERHRDESAKRCHLIPPGSSSAALTTGPSSASKQLWHCDLPNLKLLTDYIINVTAVHPAGSSSHLTSFMLEDIVKPDPPVDVRVSPHDVKHLLVEWSPPPTWTSLDIFPLKYQILYQWENRGAPKSVNLGPFENTKAELKGLISGRAYQFQVCAKEMLNLGQCSDWTPPVKVTIPKTKP
ncbi:interleukin-27 subunit beta [Kryptolebias marmoratus]|uniref:Epstein-Barr virus induced 3 n=1 Tax=Kryptolebias marmoratus TaxID=37003 RepID=A0A3Q3FZI0_KRYMA|nr:interleukin-27 subunit beta [Kryptolebias marmoratus]